MAIVLARREPYASALETNLARFGIPARFHYADPLAEHPTIRRLMKAETLDGLEAVRAQIQLPADEEIRRSIIAALRAFDALLENSATLADLHDKLKAEKLHIADDRSKVVDVLDVRDATNRPIVFVCGLTYSQYHERALFDIAVSLATEEKILSYPRFNDKGDPQLRTFFLEEPGEQLPNTRFFPKPVGQIPDLPALKEIKPVPNALSPTSIESFLQCPFQFFARRILHLRPTTEKPRDRLNLLLQGSILHRALAEGTFDTVFEDECRKNDVLPGYRTEAIRLELLRHFEAFQADKQWPLKWPAQTEQKFTIALGPEFTINGRIDLLLTGPNNQAIVIDYKYSAAAKIRERMEGDPIQAGLYLSAADRFFRLNPVGMFYCGLRQGVTWEGWHANIPGLELGEARTPSAFRELIQIAETKSVEVFDRISAGEKSVRPADRSKCRYCDYNQICRVESVGQAASAS